jgi:ATP-dependent protease ClpP protease subunit
MPDEFFYGTADELRRSADLVDGDDAPKLAAVRAVHDQRVAKLQARYPGVAMADLAGRIFCEAPERPAHKAQVWHRISNQADGAVDMYLYDEIGFWGVSAADFVQALAGIDAEEITLHINSPGGEVFDGFAIRNAVRDHPANITVQVDGLAASIASVIAMAGDKVIMNRQARAMIHDASGLSIGNAAEMRQMADVLDTLSDDIASVYAERAGGTAAEWRDAMRATTWYSADGAVEAKLADEVVPLKQASKPEAKNPTPPLCQPVVAQFDPAAFRAAIKEGTHRG